MIELGVDPFVVILAATSELALAYPGRTLPLDELSGVPMVGQHSAPISTDVIDVGLRAAGIRPRYAFRTNDNDAMQSMVRAGLGPAVMPLLAVDTSDPDIVVKRLDPPLEPRTIIVAVPRGATLSPAAERFLKIAKREGRARLQRK
jgi:DNA-binding transcriptional LysR family regulator